jgi:FkbM family methyltransferase
MLAPILGWPAYFFSDRYPEATIVAIEPSDENMALLRKNVAPYPNVHPQLAGLWPHSGPLRIVNAGTEEWGIRVQACSEQKSDLIGVTIPDILEKYQMKQIDILKIDIEGAEWPLFFDVVPTWLSSVNFLVIELHHQEDRGSFDTVVQLMEKYQLKLLDAATDLYFFSR